MSDFIVDKLCQLSTAVATKINRSEEENAEKANFELFTHTYKLSSELWLQIFRNLERNDLDSCAHVCIAWNQMIRYNNKYLPGRSIDYIIVSSKRIFSMMLSSGNIIKVYRFGKYYNSKNLRKPINDTSFMSVETHRRIKPKPPPGETQLQAYFTELRDIVNDSKKSSKKGKHDSDKYVDKAIKYGGVDAIGLHFPPFIKTYYKISTPPKFFFEKLNKLLRNLDHVDYWVFQTFTLTNAFVEKFMHYVEPVIITNDVRLIRVKRSKVNKNAMKFFLSVILGNKTILAKMPTLIENNPIISTN